MVETLNTIGKAAIDIVAVGGALYFMRKWITESKEHSTEMWLEVKQSADKNGEAINKLADHVAVSNGRTGKLEEKIAVQIALCRERNEGRSTTCRERATDIYSEVNGQVAEVINPE